MGRRGKFSAQKRRREALKRQKKQDKEERRAMRKEEQPEDELGSPVDDPDIAGIVPGPQPRLYDVEDPEDL